MTIPQWVHQFPPPKTTEPFLEVIARTYSHTGVVEYRKDCFPVLQRRLVIGGESSPYLLEATFLPCRVPVAGPYSSYLHNDADFLMLGRFYERARNSLKDWQYLIPEHFFKKRCKETAAPIQWDTFEFGLDTMRVQASAAVSAGDVLNFSAPAEAALTSFMNIGTYLKPSVYYRLGDGQWHVINQGR